MKGRESGAHDSFRTILFLMAVPLAGLAIFFFWNWLHDGITPRDAADDVVRVTTREAGRVRKPVVAGAGPTATIGPHGSEPAAPSVRTRPADEAPAVAPPASSRGRIVLIIDDLGFDGPALESVMALDPNVNCSILPNAPGAREAAERLHSEGFEVLCHLPMEPRGGESPGRNAVLSSMTDEEIDQVTKANLERIPNARGVNNHMGSRATADRRVMESVLRALPEGMYFVDSRTTGRSVAGDVARELNVRTATRHVFLDDVPTEDAVRAQLAALAAAAEKRGVAIGIGHPYAVTLRVLAEELPQLRERGFRLVRASEVVR